MYSSTPYHRLYPATITLSASLSHQSVNRRREQYYIQLSSQTHVLLEVHDSDHLLVPRKTTLANGITNVVSHCEVLTETRLDSATKTLKHSFQTQRQNFCTYPGRLTYHHYLFGPRRNLNLDPKSSHIRITKYSQRCSLAKSKDAPNKDNKCLEAKAERVLPPQLCNHWRAYTRRQFPLIRD